MQIFSLQHTVHKLIKINYNLSKFYKMFPNRILKIFQIVQKLLLFLSLFSNLYKLLIFYKVHILHFYEPLIYHHLKIIFQNSKFLDTIFVYLNRFQIQWFFLFPLQLSSIDQDHLQFLCLQVITCLDNIYDIHIKAFQE